MDVYEIDVTGDDIFKKGYGIIVLFRGEKKEEAFAYKFSSSAQSTITRIGKNLAYGVPFNTHFKIRVYTSILYFILEHISRVCYTSPSKFKLHICNDFDGHQNAIIERLKNLTVKKKIFENIGADNYIFKKHNKRSKIQKLAVQLFRGDWTETHKVVVDIDDIHNTIAKKSRRKKRW